MGTARRLLVLAMTLGLVLTVAGTAAGKPSCPGHPSCDDEPAPQTYEVTMTGDLATTCPNEPIVMSGNPTSSLEAVNGYLETNVTIAWWRHFDAGWGNPSAETPAAALLGCHGLSESAGSDNFPGKIWLSFGQDTLDLEWRFDYYWQFRSETRGNKERRVQEVLEILELAGSGLSWTPIEHEDGTLTGTVGGPVSLSLFTKAEGISEFWTPIGTAGISFDLAITPIG